MNINQIAHLDSCVERHKLLTGTTLINIHHIARQVRRPTKFLVKYFAYSLSTKSQSDDVKKIYSLRGAYGNFLLRSVLNKFLIDYVLCTNCAATHTMLYSGVDNTIIYKVCTICKYLGAIKPSNTKYYNYLRKKIPVTYVIASLPHHDTNDRPDLSKHPELASTITLPRTPPPPSHTANGSSTRSSFRRMLRYILPLAVIKKFDPSAVTTAPSPSFSTASTASTASLLCGDQHDDATTTEPPIDGAVGVPRTSFPVTKFFQDFLELWPPAYLQANDNKIPRQSIVLYSDILQMTFMANNMLNVSIHKALYEAASELQLLNLVPALLVFLLPDDITANLLKHRNLFKKFTDKNYIAQYYLLKQLEELILKNIVHMRPFILEIYQYLYELDLVTESVFIRWYEAPLKSIVHSKVFELVNMFDNQIMFF